MTLGLFNAALEFHDSQVARVMPEERDLIVQFSAGYVHRSDGQPGIDAGAGYVAPIFIRLVSAKWVGDLGLCIGKLWEGCISVGESKISLLPLPYRRVGDISAHFQFANGSELTVAASAIECRLTGDEKFVESYSC